MTTERKLLDRDDILRGLQHLDRLARADGITIDLSIYGGAALALAFRMRPATRDVDAVFQSSVTNERIREYAAEVGRAEGWPEDWLNDGVKGWVSGTEEMAPLQIPGIPVDQEGGLRIQLPTPEYLFAMKCMAMHSGVDGPHDHADIIGLAQAIGISTADEAFDIVSTFYPKNLIPSKVQFGVEELMERLRNEPADPVESSTAPKP